MDRVSKVILPLLFIVVFLQGCVEKFDPATLPRETIAVLDTSYVLIEPPFAIGKLRQPEDIFVGYDQLLYIADRDSGLFMLNLGGQVLSRRRDILHPISIGQDTRLDLIVGCEIVTSVGDTVGATVRLHLVDAAHRLDSARVDTLWREIAHPRRRFPGITVFGDNQYLAVRTGPDNSSFVDPDARVLLFDRHDVFITPIPGLRTGAGSGISINKPTAIVSFPGRRDFIITQSSEGVAYGAFWFVYRQSQDFEGWLPFLDPERPEDRGVDFIRPYRFLQPEAVTIDRARLDIFIADAGLDSVFKFNSRGRLMPESFGLTRTRGAMRKPTGLAFFQRVLYVSDAERGVVLRLRLSTDVPR